MPGSFSSAVHVSRSSAFPSLHPYFGCLTSSICGGKSRNVLTSHWSRSCDSGSWPGQALISGPHSPVSPLSWTEFDYSVRVPPGVPIRELAGAPLYIEGFASRPPEIWHHTALQHMTTFWLLLTELDTRLTTRSLVFCKNPDITRLFAYKKRLDPNIASPTLFNQKQIYF